MSSETTETPSKLDTADVVFLLNQIGFVVSHHNTGDNVVRAAQQNLKENLDPALKTPEILEATDQILKYAAAAQVPATFIPTPYNPEDYMDLPLEETVEPPPETETPPPPDESEAAPTEPAAEPL